jgi:serpin B
MPHRLLSLLALFAASVAAQDSGKPPEPAPAAALSRAKDLNGFAFDLHRALREEGKNLVASPWSVAEAFLFVRGCTTGDVRKEVDAAFRYSGAGDAADDGAARLRALFEKSGAMRAANRMWLHSKVPAGYYREETVARLTNLHGEGVARLDFGEAEQARAAINGWVSERTAKLIPELLPPDVLGAAVRLVVTNAVHFKDAWKTPFDAKRTKEAPFRVSATESVPTMLMSGRIACRFGNYGDATVVEVPFGDGTFALFAALPPEATTLAALEDGLDAEKFAAWRKDLKDRDALLVKLPRTKLASDLKLHQRGLPELGLKRAFGMSTDWSPLVGADPLGIAYVGHQAVFEMNEQGAEAAAATVVVARAGSAARPPQFVADRPFLFAIVHRATGAIVFLGRYVKPPAG